MAAAAHPVPSLLHIVFAKIMADDDLRLHLRSSAPTDYTKLRRSEASSPTFQRQVAKIITDRGILLQQGFADDVDHGHGEALDPKVLVRSIDFFERMSSDVLGKLMVRRYCKGVLRNIMHGEYIGRPHMPPDEDELQTRLVRTCFGRPGYHGAGYVMGAMIALGLQSEESMRADSYAALGPEKEAQVAWKRYGTDWEWVEELDETDMTCCRSRSDKPLVRSPSVNAYTRTYPRFVFTTTGLPPDTTFLRVGVSESVRGDDALYALRGSMRIVLPHASLSISDGPAEAMKLCLGTHEWISAAQEVDVRVSHEFAVNPRGTKCDVPPDEFADAFFAGRDADDLFLALLADVGTTYQPSDEAPSLQIVDPKMAVLAILRCCENSVFRHPATMYHSSVLEPAAVEACRQAFARCGLLARWRAFRLQPEKEIRTYSCVRRIAKEWVIPPPEERGDDRGGDDADAAPTRKRRRSS